MDGLREGFEQLRDSDIAAYEEKLARLREGEARTRERKRVMARHLEAVAGEHGVDLGRLHEVHDSEAQWLAGYLEEVRPQLLSRSSPVQADLRDQARYRALLEEAGGQNTQLLGVVQLAPDVAHFDDIEGERGNPWLFPTNTDRIHLAQKYTDSGSGCWGGYVYAPDAAYIYYGYQPPTNKVVTFEAWIELHGFYIAKANDTCFTCKEAKVYAELWIDCFQGQSTLHGPSYKIVDIEDDNIDTYGFIDKALTLTIAAPVLGNAPVLIRVSMAVGTRARGGGSYAEVNFKDKAANGAELNYAYFPCVIAYA